MNCKTCGGRIFLDRIATEQDTVELFCVICGRRYILNKKTTQLGKWIAKQEVMLSNQLQGN